MPKKPSGAIAPQQPAAQTAPAPQHESWTPPAELHEAAADHKAPHDILHSLATQAIAHPDQEHSPKIISDLVDNPSIQGHTAVDLYNHLKGKDDEAEHDTMLKLADHPNAPVSLAEQHVKHMDEHAAKGNYGYSERNNLNAAILAASKKPGVDQEMLKQHVNKYIHSDVGDTSGSYNPVAHVDPSFYMQMLLERPEMHPEAEHLTPEEREHNNRIKRLDATALENLAHSPHHTPESLMAFSQYLAQPDRYGQNKARWKKEFAQKQKAIPTEAIERLYNPEADSWDERETNEALLEHPNVSPTLLASVARSSGEGYGQEAAKAAAFANPNLPDEVVRAVVDAPNPRQTDMKRLASNPKLSADDMRKLYQRGDDSVKKKVMLAEHAPDDIRTAHWNASDKSTDAARTMLEAKKLPPEILKDLVNHKNQNVAVEALSHPSVTEDVLETAVKRKAATVADAAARHPLLAGKYFDQRVREGKMKGSELLFNKENRGAISPEKMGEYTKIFNERYKDTSDENISKTKENKEDFYKVKIALSQSPELSQQEREKNMNDVAAEYRATVNPEQDLWRGSRHAQRLAKAVIMGAKDGNEKAEDALLNTPKVIGNADLSEGHRPEFLAKAADALEGNDQATNTVRQIASNPRTPEETFQKITGNRQFFRSPSQYVTGDNRDGMATVFDDRWANDPQKDEKFRQLAQNGDARRAVVRSNSAPEDAWRTSFEGLDDTERSEFLSEHPDHAVKMADDEIYTRMLNGQYNNDIGGGRYGREHNRVQVKALQAAGPEHAGEVINYLVSSSHPDAPDNVKMDPKEFAENLNSEMYESPRFEDIQKAAIVHQPAMGVELRAKKILKDSDTYGRERSPETLNRFVEHLRTDGTEGMTPEQQKLAFGDRINAMLSDLNTFGKSRYSRTAVDSLLQNTEPAKTGALDFLADGGFSADPDVDDNIRAMAMKAGLLSDQKISQVMNTSPAAFDESLRALDKHARAERIRQTLSGGDIHPDLLDSIVKNLDNATLNPAYKQWHSRGDTKANHVTTASQLAMNLGRALASAGQFGNIGVAASKILKDEVDSNRGGMSKDSRKTVMKALQQGAEAVAPQAKGQIAAWIYKTANQRGAEDMLPPSMVSTLAKEAIKNNDVDTLMQLADTKEPPASVTAAIAKMVDKPEVLSDEHMKTVPYLLQNAPVTPKTVRKIVDGFLARPALAQSRNDLYSGLSKMISGKKYSSSGNAQDVEGEAIRAAAFDPSNEYAQKMLVSLTKSSYPENAKSAYLSLPDQIHPEVREASVHLEAEVANDPEVMQKSHSGWRLGTMVRSIDNLNKENRSILTDRLSLYQADDMGIERPAAYAKIVSAHGTSGDDCTKLYRSMNPQEKADFLEKLSSYISGGYTDYNYDGVANVMPHVSADMKADLDTIHGNTDEPGQVDAIHRVSKQIEHAGLLAVKLAATAKNLKKNDTKAAFHAYAGEVLDNADQMVGKLETAMQNPKFYKASAANAGRALMHSLSAVADTEGHEGLNSQKLLDTFVRARDMTFDAFGSRDVNAPGHAQIGVFASNWMTNARVQPEHWQDALKKIPEMQFMVGNRQSIEPELYKALDLKMMMRTEPKDAYDALSNVISNVDSSRAHEVVPQLMDDVEQHAGESEAAIYHYKRNYSKLATEAVCKHPTTLKAKHLREILSRDGIDESAKRRIEGFAYDLGAGGREFFDHGLGEMKEWTKKKEPYAFDVATNLAGSPFLTEEDAKNFSTLIKSKFGSETGKINLISKLLDNQQVPEQIVSGLYNDVSQGHKEGTIDDRTRKKVVEKTIKHKNLPRDTFFKLYDETKDLYPTKIEVGKPFNPALVNPRFGGELFRSLPLSVPKEVPNVDSTKLVNKATHGEKAEKIRQALAFIPPEGIPWAQFKKVAPKLENVPEIKQMFMAKNNKPVRPEDVVAEMRKHAPDEYHVTYTKWNGAQRHLHSNMPFQEDSNSPPNLVMQLNTGPDMEKQLNQDPKLWNFFQYIQKSANHVHNDQIGGHPVTPHIASWVRLDTSGGKDGWVIEEFQSDFSAKLRKQLKHVFSDRSTIDIDGQKYTQDEANAMVKHIEKTFGSWVDASYQAVEELARKHGVKSLFVHGQGIRRTMSGVSQDKHVEVFDEAYERQPQKRGFQPCQYTDYPNHSKSMAENAGGRLSPEEKVAALKCWKKDLT